MTWWQALILGIVEGLTEYLPVSSTGHLILAAWLLGLSRDYATWQATNTFNIVIQIGAILAVLGVYRARIVQMIQGLAGRNPKGLRLAMNVLIAFVPAAAVGPALNKHIEAYLFQPWPVVAALFAGAWLMLAVGYGRRFTHTQRKGVDLDGINWQMALLIGAGQCVAMWPGTSRSMVTIVAALLLGVRPRAAAEFSFLLGLVTLSGATAFKAYEDGGQMFSQISLVAFLVGLTASAVSAALAVRWFVAFLTRHGVTPFGWYRLALAAVLAVLMGTGMLVFPVFD